MVILSMINYFLHRNHAWVSFEGFAEAYNDAFCVSKENGAYTGLPTVVIRVWLLRLPEIAQK